MSPVPRAPLSKRLQLQFVRAFNWWQTHHPVYFAGERLDDAIRSALHFAVTGRPFPKPTKKGDTWE